MFNTNIKLDYIKLKMKNTSLPINYLEREFERVGEYEELLNKDLCNFTIQEIINYYKMRTTSYIDVLASLNSQFKLYTNWCLLNNYVSDNQNHYTEINKDILYECINIKKLSRNILTKKDITKLINSVINYRDKFIILAIFEGIKGKNFCEIINLKLDDIDEKNMTAKLCTGRTVNVSKELIEYAQLSAKEYIYYCDERNMTLKDPPDIYNAIIKDRLNCSYDKKTKEDINKGRRIYRTIVKLLEDRGVGTNSITISGQIQAYNDGKDINYINKQFDKNYAEYKFKDKYKDFFTR